MGRYITRESIEAQHGVDNVEAWGDLDGDQDAGKITARIDKAIAYAETFIDDRFRQSKYAIPFRAESGDLEALFSEVARFAGCWLYKSRGSLDSSNLTQKMDAVREECLAEFNRYLDGSATLAAARKTGSGSGAPRVAGGPRFAASVARAEGTNQGIPGGCNNEPWPGSWK